MAFLDHGIAFDTRAPRLSRPPFAVSMAVLLALAVFAAALVLRGFGDNGVRFGTQLVWRFNSLFFFVALVAGPLGRLVPPLRGLADKGRLLLQGFCAAMLVYFAAILVPNLLAVPDGVREGGITAGMTFFVAFTGTVTLVMAAAVNRGLCERVGRKACRAMLGVATIYFWLCYSLIGLAHISGPHRPDTYYELSVILMVIALLVRFGEHFLHHCKQVPAR
jgi:hypothetical protein